jgi:hypothetical protein
MSSSSTDGRRDPFAPVADPPSAAGVPAHLVDHLHAPDERVFALKAELDAARRAARAAEEKATEALRVAAAADRRSRVASEREARKLADALARAEEAERALAVAARRADAGERGVVDAERRSLALEAELREKTRDAEDARERLDEARAVGLTLEDDVEVLRERVRDLERGVPRRSVASQTEYSSDDLARGDRVVPAMTTTTTKKTKPPGGFRDAADGWLRELAAVGADASVDPATGLVVRASARPPLAPRGLGVDLLPRPPPDLGAAGYAPAAAVAAAARAVDALLLPAVERALERSLPLREELRAILENHVAPIVDARVARVTLGDRPGRRHRGALVDVGRENRDARAAEWTARRRAAEAPFLRATRAASGAARAGGDGGGMDARDGRVEDEPNGVFLGEGPTGTLDGEARDVGWDGDDPSWSATNEYGS